jgi:surface protein
MDPNGFAWPVEMLGRILHFLAMDGASFAWQHLVYLTNKNDALRRIAKVMQRPLVVRIGFDGDAKDKRFALPFLKATVALIEIDWGDDTPIQVINSVGEGYAEHEYQAVEGKGEYVVRVFPHGTAPVAGVWLDHLGWNNRFDYDTKGKWWRPLRSFDALGSLGIFSLGHLFCDADEFNLPLSSLDVSHVSNMQAIFHHAHMFNQPIGRWNVSNVTDMADLFRSAYAYNQSMDRWDVSRVKSMEAMFFDATNFNQPIGDWDVSNVVDISFMFASASQFDQDVSQWNVGNVQNMQSMFQGATKFNQPIGRWNVHRVTCMNSMFRNASAFAQDIGDWDVSNVRDSREMFLDASSFDGSCVSRWKLPPTGK